MSTVVSEGSIEKRNTDGLIAHAFMAPRLLNTERAYEVMDRYGLEGLVASIPHNIYYLSSHSGIMQWMGRHFSTFAFLPRNEQAEPALVVPGTMLYHFDYRPTWIDNIKPVSGPVLESDGEWVLKENGDPASRPEPGIWPTREGAQLSRGDKIQLALFKKYHGKTVSSALYGLKEAIVEAGAHGGKIGYDDPRIGGWLSELGLNQSETVDASNIFKHIRQAKTENEITLLRRAAKCNEEALNFAIDKIVPGQALSEIEMNHARKWADLGGTAKWLIANVNGVNSGAVNLGDWMKLDSVGTYKGYHGDVGRTVMVGTPPDELARRIEANIKVSQIIYDQIRPGMRYVETCSMFSELMLDEGFKIAFAGPHDVGLEHTDHPVDGVGTKVPATIPYDQLEFLNGTVFTLDMPHNEIGWGTTHVEDMMVVRETGCEPLSSMDISLRIRS